MTVAPAASTSPWDQSAIAALAGDLGAGGVLMVYGGLIAPADVARLRDNVRASVTRLEVTDAVVRKVFSAVVEFADNIAHYSHDAVRDSAGERLGGMGVVTVRRIDDRIEVVSANPAPSDSARKVVEEVARINALARDDLRRVYREKSRRRTTKESKGAGLGLLHIARTTPHPIQAHLAQTADRDILLLGIAFEA